MFLGLVFLRLRSSFLTFGDKFSYVWGLVFLRLRVTNFYVLGLVFFLLDVSN